MIMSNGIISNEQCRYALLRNAFINVNTFSYSFLTPRALVTPFGRIPHSYKSKKSLGLVSEPKGEALVRGIFNGLCSLKRRTLI